MPADAVGLEVEALVEAVFDVNAGFADAYTAELPALMPKAGEHVGHEENVEAGLLQRNDGTADVCCFDRQVQLPGTRRTVDIVGSTSKNAPTLVAIEVKRYPDNRIWPSSLPIIGRLSPRARARGAKLWHIS